MYKVQVPKNHFSTANTIAEILEIYADAGVPGHQIETLIALAIKSGQEGPLTRHSIWTELPIELRVPIAKIVSNIANSASRWKSEQNPDLLFASRIVEAQNTDYIRAIGETTQYLVKLLGQGKSVTISKPTDTEPYVVTIRASGYPDKIVDLGSFLNASMALVIQLNPKPDEIILYA